MLEKEFVPHEQALELKELGFNEPCLAFYYNNPTNQLSEPLSTWAIVEDYKNVFQISHVKCTAPTFSQAFRWFREKYGYVGYVKTSFIIIKNEARHEAFDAYEFIVEHHTEFFVVGTKFKSYEEAETACLNKLIEIVKQKQ